MTKTDIALAFSNGKFKDIYNYINKDAIWNNVGHKTIVGKRDIQDHCEQVYNYFQSVETNFRTLHIITDGSRVVINGTAEFTRDKKRISFVNACDIYEFNSSNEIQTITSYCIQTK
jgi:limonene-1,2-epoxide hydrolase